MASCTDVDLNVTLWTYEVAIDSECIGFPRVTSFRRCFHISFFVTFFAISLGLAFL